MSRTVPAPKDLGIEVIGIREGADVEIDLRLEAVMEGVLVTGTARGPVQGECVRCLEPVEYEFEADFQELYAYPESEPVAGRTPVAPEEEDEEALRLEGDLFDLEPVLRDAVVLELPLQPVCREDCPGLCPDCGARLADDPDHQHNEAVDPRWAALQEFAVASPDTGPDAGGAGEYDDSGASRADENQEK
ncbi:uncharacterized protein FHU37_003536 [Allostreptomyces psammosilenae]|uniref:DUF177 domain-containing protein n=1 Tax=Allostreptomyces psammosilenae TaxID=1892865 RepID=A0A852ZW22_9ACTN|nr:uncharacterized protein [Allostreptomyces psammosilenae]